MSKEHSKIKTRKFRYKGRDILIHFDLDRCTHVAECLMGLPQVFNNLRKPWVMPDNAEANQIAEVILRCPTGSLHFERLDGGWEEPIPDFNTISITANGPHYIHGNVEIYDDQNNLLLKDTRVGICRCGKSKILPLCDNTHSSNNFREKGLMKPTQGKTEKKPGPTALKIVWNPKGPLKLSGPMTIRTARDNVGFRGDTILLCGCGKSKNKPFCDGSHGKGLFSKNK